MMVLRVQVAVASGQADIGLGSDTGGALSWLYPAFLRKTERLPQRTNAVHGAGFQTCVLPSTFCAEATTIC